MNRPRLLLAGLLVMIPLAFVGGYRLAGREAGTAPSGERKVLYWVDPMNPSFRSSEPGTAPCGMPLEPVYADGEAPAPNGAVRVRADRQQLIGVRVEAVNRRAASRNLRLPGRVAVDESRLYRIYSISEGWIRELGASTTGSVVDRDARLASFYSQEILGPQQAYLYALEALDRYAASGTASDEQLTLNRRNVRNTRQALLNLGMGETQVDEIARTRQGATLVDIRSPARGFVLQRNVSIGQRFDRATELFTIADLRRVWVLADVLEADAAALAPGTRAIVRFGGATAMLAAVVSAALPQFDPATRTFKVRLEADNPGFVLRPGMLVDVEASFELPEALVVPASAVIDSGLRRTVFVERDEGIFEPREIMTGWSASGDVEVVAGLEEGERVVVSGNFLLDSESRMRASPPDRAKARDPICGMEVDVAEARAQGLVLEHDGRTTSFCAPGCRDAFAAKLGHDAR
ncbi:MAG TPA: efflux RND transporter periplasmic adaptor subunit [Candidatus Polarisedimenticolaceae bacterium]